MYNAMQKKMAYKNYTPVMLKVQSSLMCGSWSVPWWAKNSPVQL